MMIDKKCCHSKIYMTLKLFIMVHEVGRQDDYTKLTFIVIECLLRLVST